MTPSLAETRLKAIPLKVNAYVPGSEHLHTITSFEGSLLGLSDVGLEFLNLCNGKHTLSDIGKILRERYGSKKENKDEKAVLVFCEHLMSKRLVTLVRS